MTPTEREFVYVQRLKKVATPNGVEIVDYGRVEIPKEHLYATLKSHPLWKQVSGPEKMAPQIEPPAVPDGHNCPLCPKVFKTEAALLKHKKTHAATPAA